MGLIFSGIQPTGNLHLGNYLGAMRNWISLQHTHESLFCIVDLHALTTSPNPESLREWSRGTAAAYIAVGIDLQKSTIFIQSAVPAHTELAWIFSCLTPLGWLNRMTQFKEKAGKQKEMANLGLYSYPVLMAADILLYKATLVPVAEDQTQHIELTRDIAGAFNRLYDRPYFQLPEQFLLKITARIMSLRDGTSKMSKSDPSDFSRIHLTDDNDTIALKIRKAKTDMDFLCATPQEMEGRPEALNLLGIYGALLDQSLEKTCENFSGKTFSVLKKDLTDTIIKVIEPIRNEMLRLQKDQQFLDETLEKGAEKARQLANQNMREIREIIGCS